MAKRVFKNFKTKKDIIIPAGTVFQSEQANITDPIEFVFGLSKNTSGYIVYFLDNSISELSEWFEEIKPSVYK